MLAAEKKKETQPVSCCFSFSWLKLLLKTRILLQPYTLFVSLYQNLCIYIIFLWIKSKSEACGKINNYWEIIDLVTFLNMQLTNASVRHHFKNYAILLFSKNKKKIYFIIIFLIFESDFLYYSRLSKLNKKRSKLLPKVLYWVR